MLSLSAARRLSAGGRAPLRRQSALLSSRPNNTGGRIVGSSIARRPLLASAPLLRSQVPTLSYSTERIVALRSQKKEGEDLPKTIYDASRETENCGVGLVASLKSVASRKVVEDADEMLIRMSHRGGVGCCPASGDGAGEFV